MYRRDFLKAVGLGVASLVLPSGCASGGVSEGKRRPNIVFILIDDMGWKDVGFMGSEFYETPNIDKLASQGIVFTNAYANAPNCAPTRACLMSGQYTPRHGVYTVGTSARGKSRNRKLIPITNTTTLDPRVVTIGEALKSAGYATASMGKWHLGDDPEAGPVGQGFDLNIGGNKAGHPKTYFSPYKNKDLTDGPDGEYLTDRLTDEALKFIEDNKDGEFFLYLPHYAVHTPIQAKKELTEKYKSKSPSNGQSNAAYAAMIESTDEGVGRIMDKLDELQIADDTVVIFFSDNGGHGVVTSMQPLRGSKGMLYEGGIREPMAVRWPGKIKAGAVCDEPVIGIDFYPTLLELAGAKRKSGQILDGVSILGLLRQRGGIKRKAIFWHFPAYLEASGRGKGAWRTTPAGAVRCGDYKLIEFFEDGRVELYNLAEDISEKNDLAESMPEKRKELHEMLIGWRKSVDAPVPTDKNPEYAPQV